LAVSFAAYTVYRNGRAQAAVAREDYRGLVRSGDAAPWLKARYADYYLHARGVLLWDQGRVTESLAVMERLPAGFWNTGLTVKELRYQLALTLLDQGMEDTALSLLASLEGYLDSGAYIEAVAARRQAEQGTGTPLERYRLYALADPLLDTSAALPRLWPQLWRQGRRDYAAGSWATAEPCFSVLPAESYPRAESYLAACALALEPPARRSAEMALALKRLRALAAEIPAGPVALSNGYLYDFLTGRWHSESGGDFLLEEGRLEFSHFATPAGGYAFSGGAITLQGGGFTARISYVDFDTADITLGGQTHRFTRQS
jgi:hypothetical protein